MKRDHLIYEFTCPLDDCAHQQTSYIGMTTTSLSRRLTMHKQEGAIKSHMNNKHNTAITRTILDNNTKIIYNNPNFIELKFAEAILIELKKPNINIQQQISTVLPTRKIINDQSNNRHQSTNNNNT